MPNRYATVPTPVRPRQLTCAYLGDSLTAGSNATYNYGDAFPTYAGIYSQGRIVPAGFYGVGGQRSDQILARVWTALAVRPSYLAVLAGTNDIGQGISLGQTDAQIITTIKANLRAMYKAAESVGTVPVAITIPPNNDSSNSNRRQLLIIKANVWIRRYAYSRGLPLVDFYTLLVKDGVTATPAGNYKDIYANDGTHPNGAGAAAMGNLFAQVLTGQQATAAPFTAVDTVDQFQSVLLIKNPLFKSATSNPGKFPDTYGVSGAPIADTHTVYTLGTDAVLPGNVLSVAMDVSATNSGGASSANFSAAAGDLIAMAGYFSNDGLASIQAQLILAGITYKPVTIASGGSSGAITRGMYYMEIVCPTSGTTHHVNLIGGFKAGTATAQMFTYPTVINLTQTIGETVPITPN